MTTQKIPKALRYHDEIREKVAQMGILDRLAWMCGTSSQSSIALQMGISQSTLSRWINGMSYPNVRYLAALYQTFPSVFPDCKPIRDLYVSGTWPKAWPFNAAWKREIDRT